MTDLFISKNFVGTRGKKKSLRKKKKKFIVNSFFPVLLTGVQLQKVTYKWKNSSDFLLENIGGSQFTELTTSLNQGCFLIPSFYTHPNPGYPQLQKRQYFSLMHHFTHWWLLCSNQTGFNIKFRLSYESCLHCVNSWLSINTVLSLFW